MVKIWFMDLEIPGYSHNCAASHITVRLLHAPPCLEFTFQQLLKMWEPREPHTDAQEIDGDPHSRRPAWWLDSLESVGAAGATLAYCRVKYSTFLISHSAPLYLRQNYADWYIRDSMWFPSLSWKVREERCLWSRLPSSSVLYDWTTAEFMGCFSSVFCIQHALIPLGRRACLVNKSW